MRGSKVGWDCFGQRCLDGRSELDGCVIGETPLLSMDGWFFEGMDYRQGIGG